MVFLITVQEMFFYPKSNFINNEIKDIDISVNEAWTEEKPKCGSSNSVYFGKITCWLDSEEYGVDSSTDPNYNGGFSIIKDSHDCNNCCSDEDHAVVGTSDIPMFTFWHRGPRCLFVQEQGGHLRIRLDVNATVDDSLPAEKRQKDAIYFCPKGSHYQEKSSLVAFNIHEETDWDTDGTGAGYGGAHYKKDSVNYVPTKFCHGNEFLYANASTTQEYENKPGCWTQHGSYHNDDGSYDSVAWACRIADPVFTSSYFDNYGKYDLDIKPFYIPYESANDIIEFRVGEDQIENKKIVKNRVYNHYPWLAENSTSSAGMKEGRLYFRIVNQEIINKIKEDSNITTTNQARCTLRQDFLNRKIKLTQEIATLTTEIVALDENNNPTLYKNKQAEKTKKEKELATLNLKSLYQDNSGTIIIDISVEKEEISFIKGFKDILDDRFDFIFSTESRKRLFENTVSGTFQAVLNLVFTLYIIFFGLMISLGTAEIKKGDLMSRAIKISLIYVLVSPNSWPYFSQVITFFEQGSEDLANRLISGSRDLSNKVTVFSQLDTILTYLIQPQIHKKILAMMISPLIVGTLMGIITYFALLLIFYTIIKILIIYFYLKIILVLLFIVAPFFIICSFFKTTFGLFENWLKEVISASMQIFTLLASSSLFLYFILSLIVSIFSFSVCWQPIWTVFGLDIISFYKYRGFSENYSLVGNVSLGPSFTEVIFFFAVAYIFRYAMDKFVELGKEMSDAGIPAASSLAKNAINAAESAVKQVGSTAVKTPLGLAWQGAKEIARSAGINTRLSLADRIKANTRYNAWKNRDHFLRDMNKKINEAIGKAKTAGLSKEKAREKAIEGLNETLEHYPPSMKEKYGKEL